MGYNYELRELEIEELEGRFHDYMRGELEQFIAPSSRLKILKRKTVSPKKLEFVREVRRLGLNIDDIYADTGTKRRLLREIKGYRSLRCPKSAEYSNGRMPLNSCEPERIGKAARNIFYSDSKALNIAN